MPGGTFPVNVMIYTIKNSKSLENKYKRRGCQGASFFLLVITSPWSVLVKLKTTYLFSFCIMAIYIIVQCYRFTRIVPAALIKFFAPQMWRLFEGNPCLRAALI